jgi:uncharacterized iron-regulated membrane protein
VVRPTALIKRSLIFLHRWMGVALSLIFMLWFVSGIVMMYWTFPDVTAADRLERAPALDPARITLTAAQAYATLGREQPPASVRLTTFDGRPVYRFGGGGGGGRGRGGAGAAVYADDGTPHGGVNDAMIDRVASAWAGRPLAEADKRSVEEVDQWTVGGLRNLRPLFKYSWPDGQQVYVNGNTAEVAQYTTTESRFWAYLGAIPHWLYFTPLRKHQPQWFSFVVWSSLIGTVAALLGVVIIIWMYSPKKRYRHAGAPTSIPYRGWKRWHAIAGLFFGIVTATWAFSGLLSMGPFPIIDRLTELTVPAEPTRDGDANARGARGGHGGARGPNIAGALRGSERFSLASYGAKDEKSALASLSGFVPKELEYTSFAGEPVYLATNGRGETRIVPVRGEPTDSFEADAVLDVVRRTAGSSLAELRIIDQYDAYYLDRRRERPLPVIFARMNDVAGTRFYVDPKTARVVGNYSQRNWVNRWLYHGLHSLDFPWLYNYRPLWDIVVITLMLGGTAVCVTSLVLSYRILAKKLAAAIRTRFNAPNEDLPLEMKAS